MKVFSILTVFALTSAKVFCTEANSSEANQEPNSTLPSVSNEVVQVTATSEAPVETVSSKKTKGKRSSLFFGFKGILAKEEPEVKAEGEKEPEVKAEGEKEPEVKAEGEKEPEDKAEEKVDASQEKENLKKVFGSTLRRISTMGSQIFKGKGPEVKVDSTVESEGKGESIVEKEEEASPVAILAASSSTETEPVASVTAETESDKGSKKSRAKKLSSVYLPRFQWKKDEKIDEQEKEVNVTEAPTVCPPKDFDSLKEFDLYSYISHAWYAQEQMEVKYQPKSDFFCVKAQYVREGLKDVAVYNYARRGGIHGEVQFVHLKASIPSLDEPAKILVGPRFLPSFLMGDYWVVAAGSYPLSNASTSDYDWALVTSGAPKVPGENGKCRVGDGKDGNGIWILTKDPIVDESVMDHIHAVASEKGIDTTLLKRVVHEGCDYSFNPPSHYVKPDENIVSEEKTREEVGLGIAVEANGEEENDAIAVEAKENDAIAVESKTNDAIAVDEAKDDAIAAEAKDDAIAVEANEEEESILAPLENVSQR